MILKFSEDMTMDEVGAVLGKSRAAAKLLIYRAVQRLRRDLAPAAVAELALAS
jgi:DNA-directed RNA polymerase specialized sigma24 family protein